MQHCTCYRADCHECYPINDLICECNDYDLSCSGECEKPRYLSPIFTCQYCDRDFGSSGALDEHMPCDMYVWHLQHHQKWTQGCRACDDEYPTVLCGPGLCACGGCDGACAYPELRSDERRTKIRHTKIRPRKGLGFDRAGASISRYRHGNYIQRTYALRKRYGFPFSCLTFRDRYR